MVKKNSMDWVTIDEFNDMGLDNKINNVFNKGIR